MGRENSHKPRRIYKACNYFRWRGLHVLIVIIILVLLLFGSFPVFPYSRNWGYYPTGGLGTILLIILVLYLLHVI